MVTIATSSSAQAGAPPVARRSAVAAALGAAVLGVVILFGLGFSHISVAHNAAHDARHAAGFPCH